MPEEDRVEKLLKLGQRQLEASAGPAAPMSKELSDYVDAARRTHEAAREVMRHVHMALGEIESLDNEGRERVIRTLLGLKISGIYGPLAGFDVLMALRNFCIEKCEETDPNWELPDWADPPGFFEPVPD